MKLLSIVRLLWRGAGPAAGGAARNRLFIEFAFLVHIGLRTHKSTLRRLAAGGRRRENNIESKLFAYKNVQRLRKFFISAAFFTGRQTGENALCNGKRFEWRWQLQHILCFCRHPFLLSFSLNLCKSWRITFLLFNLLRMYQFGVHRRNATAKEAKGMAALTGLTWLVLLAAAMLLLLPIGEGAATPTAETSSFIEACQVQHNVTAEELEKFPADPSPEDIDLKFKCYSNCLMNGMGFMDADGKLDAESMHKLGILTDDSYENMMECKAANDMEDDPCEYSFGMVLCMQMIALDGQEEEELDEIEDERRK